MISKFEGIFDGDLNGYSIAYSVWLDKLRREIAGDEDMEVTGTFQVEIRGGVGEVPRITKVGQCKVNLQDPIPYAEIS